MTDYTDRLNAIEARLGDGMSAWDEGFRDMASDQLSALAVDSLPRLLAFAREVLALAEDWSDQVGPADFGHMPVANVRAIAARTIGGER